MTEQSTDGTERTRRAPTINDDGTVSLWGVGPRCPGCGGPTHSVTGDECERPWWCKECHVRLTGDGDYGSQASFPAGNEPNNCEADTATEQESDR
jgi:hypothetical protein